MIGPGVLGAMLLGLGAIWIQMLNQSKIDEQLQRTRDVATTQAAVFELNLSRSISAARILGSYVELQQGDTSDFEHHAQIIHASLGGITNLQLAPDGIVRKIYPLAGHERALGHNLLKDDARRKEADLAIRSRSMTLAGPFKLVQGGTAVVARNPVFIDKDSPYLVTQNSGALSYALQGDERFWGYASVLIYFDEVLALTQLNSLAAQGFDYQLWRHHPDTQAVEVMAGDMEMDGTYSVTHSINLPNSTWHLVVERHDQPISATTTLGYWSLNLTFALLLSAWYFNLLRRPRQLEAEVASRTAALREAQEALRLSATAFESHEAIAITDLDGKTLKVNQAFTQITGFEADEICGRPFQFWGVSATQTQEAWNRLDKTGYWEGEIEQQRKNGESYPSWLSISVVKDPEGNPSHFVSHFVDITQRRLAEIELQAAKERAEAGSRAKSEFLAMMSHEIRTPLNGVLGLIDLVRDTALTNTQKHYLQTAYQSGEALLTIINDVLDFSKIEAGKLELDNGLVTTDELLNQIHRLLGPQASAQGLALRVAQHGEIPLVFGGDPCRLRQILLNLVGNAIKFTEQGGVTLQLQGEHLEEQRYRLRFEVHDTGIGIDHAHLNRLFERFTTLDVARNNQGGTGLGLSISQQLVDLMGGTLEVESEPGRGSRFWFEVEVSESAVTSGQGSASAASSHFGDTAILVVEDVPVNRLVVKEMLKAAGYSVTLAANGLEAITLAAQGDYSLIFMDISMPEMDGLRATTEIRKITGDRGRVPIIAMTAHALKREKARCLAAGMNDYLTKPLTRQALLEKVSQWRQPAAASGSSGADATPHVQRC